MEFVARRRKIKVILDSGEYLIDVPSIGDVQALDERIKSRASDTEVIEIYLDFLSRAGLPKDELVKLDADLFLQLVTFITSPQKKS